MANLWFLRFEGNWRVFKGDNFLFKVLWDSIRRFVSIKCSLSWLSSNYDLLHMMNKLSSFYNPVVLWDISFALFV